MPQTTETNRAPSISRPRRWKRDRRPRWREAIQSHPHLSPARRSILLACVPHMAADGRFSVHRATILPATIVAAEPRVSEAWSCAVKAGLLVLVTERHQGLPSIYQATFPDVPCTSACTRRTCANALPAYSRAADLATPLLYAGATYPQPVDTPSTRTPEPDTARLGHAPVVRPAYSITTTGADESEDTDGGDRKNITKGRTDRTAEEQLTAELAWEQKISPSSAHRFINHVRETTGRRNAWRDLEDFLAWVENAHSLHTIPSPGAGLRFDATPLLQQAWIEASHAAARPHIVLGIDVSRTDKATLDAHLGAARGLIDAQAADAWEHELRERIPSWLDSRHEDVAA